MNYIIYLDVFWAVNTIMDIILLWLLGKIRKHAITKIRLAAGGIIGGFGACMTIYLRGIPIVVSFFLQNVVLAYGMIRISYKKESIRDFFFDLIHLYGLGILLNGFISTILNRNFPYRQNDSKVYAGLVLFIGALCSLIILFFWKRCRKFRIEEKNLYDVIIKNAGLCCRGKALLDTGNQLREPITKRPVIVAEYDVVKVLFTEELQNAILQFGSKEMDTVHPIKWIPYHSLGNRNGFMPGVYVDEMLIHMDEKEKIVGGVLLGIVFESVSTQKQYQFILHEQYITE